MMISNCPNIYLTSYKTFNVYYDTLRLIAGCVNQTHLINYHRCVWVDTVYPLMIISNCPNIYLTSYKTFNVHYDTLRLIAGCVNQTHLINYPRCVWVDTVYPLMIISNCPNIYLTSYKTFNVHYDTLRLIAGCVNQTHLINYPRCVWVDTVYPLMIISNCPNIYLTSYKTFNVHYDTLRLIAGCVNQTHLINYHS